MKKTLLLTALLYMAPHLHAAVGDTLDLTQGFVADGVITKRTEMSDGSTEFSVDLLNSTRFYDSTKGWATSLSGSDSSMCWAHTGANLIQYWQSYYGVFYKPKDGVELPYGTEHTRTVTNSFGYQYTIADPMRISVAADIIKGAYNQAGQVSSATDYFFTYEAGGYYSEYFGEYQYPNPPQTAVYTEAVNTQQELKNALLPALGISETNGTYQQSEAGIIAHVNGTVNGGAHTLTCYGVTLDSDGNIVSLYYADSDDNQMTGAVTDGSKKALLKEAFVKESGGSFYLYSDADCSTAIYTGGYAINGVTYIQTPEVLKKMLAEYSDTTNEAQVWNGKSSVWETQTATTEQLPTEATGWDINVNGDNIDTQHQGYYHTYSTDGRAVIFDAHGMNESSETQYITVTGAITPGSITVKDGGNYYLKAGSVATIAGSGDVTIESGSKLSSEINLGSRNIVVKGGAHYAYAMSDNTALTGTISAETGSIVQFHNSSSNDIQYSYSASNIGVNTFNSIKESTLIVGDINDIASTALDFSNIYGDLTVKHLVLYGSSSIDTVWTTSVTETFSSLKTLQTATSVNLQSVATGPMMLNSLDLSSATTIIMETAVDLNSNTLTLGTSQKQLTLDAGSFLMNNDGLYTFDLFTSVGTLNINNETTSTSKEWAAATFFTGDYITDNTMLVFDNGIVQLRGLSIPEPGSTALGLLALAALAARRRRV